MYYRGYRVSVDMDGLMNGSFYPFNVRRPDGTMLSNTVFYRPGYTYGVCAITFWGAKRKVMRAIRRDNRRYRF